MTSTSPLARLRMGLATGAWLDAPRIRRWSVAVFVVHLVCGLLIAAGSHGWLMHLHSNDGTTDFVSFFAAGKIASGPLPADVYNRAVHFAAERAATSPAISYVYFFYPPVFLIICQALAKLPYLVAFFVFQLLTLSLCLAVLRAILGRPPPGWYWPVLGFTPLLWNIGFGQNALLTAALFGGGCLLLTQGRHLAGGLVLGMLIYKPHTGLLIPLALLAARDWRAIAGAAASVAASVTASVLLFGAAAWPAFLSALSRSQHEFAHGEITPFAAMVNLSGTLRDHGLSAPTAVACQTVAQLLLALCVVWCWRHRTAAADARAPLLISAAILTMPVVLFYDLTLLSVAAAILVAQAWRSRFLPYERTILATAWLAGVLCFPLSRAWHVPLGLACCLLIFGISLRRHIYCHSINDLHVKLRPAALNRTQAWLALPQNEVAVPLNMFAGNNLHD